MTTALGLLAVLALILANGYFVATEFGFVAARRTRIEDLAESGDRRAQVAVRVLQRLSFMLSGAQLGITVTSLVVGFIADRTLGRAIEPLLGLAGIPQQARFGIALAIGFVVATTMQMILGELAPKNLAIAHPESYALALARSTWWYLRVAGPLVRLFDNASNALLRAIGIEPADEIAEGVSPDELSHIIEESSREGALTDSQAALLSRSLEFRSLRAADAMVPRTAVVWLPPDASCEDLRRLAVDTGHSRFPVAGADLDDVIGVVQAKDVLSVPVERRPVVPVRSMTRPCLAVPESALLGPLLSDLRKGQTQLAVVVDEHGGTAGVVTLEDIVEELVGAIEDEYDPADPGVRALPDGSHVVPGSWRLDEVERATGIALPEGDYDTLSGFVMERLGRIPVAGDQIETDTAIVSVEGMAGLALGTARLEPVAPAAPEPDERGRRA